MATCQPRPRRHPKPGSGRQRWAEPPGHHPSGEPGVDHAETEYEEGCVLRNAPFASKAKSIRLDGVDEEMVRIQRSGPGLPKVGALGLEVAAIGETAQE